MKWEVSEAPEELDSMDMSEEAGEQSCTEYSSQGANKDNSEERVDADDIHDPQLDHEYQEAMDYFEKRMSHVRGAHTILN